jgi:hydrogenase maturation protease
VKRVLIGVGNSLRGDDGVGLVVAEGVKSMKSFQAPGGSFGLIDLWEGADEVILVDAARSGSTPGTIHRIDAGKEPLPRSILVSSTHSVGLAETVEMARQLARLPARVTVYGVEVGDLTHGADLSPDVRRAAETLVEMIDGA